MSRIEHEHWDCPICHARGACAECAGIGSAQAYYDVQQLHEHAIRHENGIAARVLEIIELWPDGLRDRAWWVSRMVAGALRQARLAA